MNCLNIYRVGLLLAFGLAGIGCAFGTRQVTLTYPPDVKIDGSVVQAETTIKDPNGIKIAVRTFRDERSNKTTIGEVRNGYAMKTSDAIAQNDVAEWITGALAYELKAEGFEVIADEASFSTATAIVSGDVITVYCTALFSYEGEVSFYGSITENEAEIHRNRYTAQGTAGMNWAATSASYGKSLGDALQKAAKAFVIDIKQEISKPSIQVATKELTNALEPLSVETVPLSETAPLPVRSESAPRTVPTAVQPLQSVAPSSTPTRLLSYGYLQWEYTDASKGTFPLEISIAKLGRKEKLGRGERSVAKADAGAYSVLISDPDTNTRNKPNWDPYEVQIDVERSGYTRIVIETDPKGENGIISVSIFSDDELVQKRFIGEK